MHERASDRVVFIYYYYLGLFISSLKYCSLEARMLSYCAPYDDDDDDTKDGKVVTRC